MTGLDVEQRLELGCGTCAACMSMLKQIRLKRRDLYASVRKASTSAARRSDGKPATRYLEDVWFSKASLADQLDSAAAHFAGCSADGLV